MNVSSVFLFHSLTCAWYAFLVYRIFNLETNKDAQHSDIFAYGWPWKYLTNLNLILQTFYFGVSMLTDLLVLVKQHQIAKSMFSFRDLLFCALALPCSMLVSMNFWIIYFYDRELIVPKGADLIFSAWMNHALHTVILPLSLMELFITPHCYPSKGKGLSLLVISAFGYGSWILWIYSATGKWVYPIFGALSPLSIAVFFFGNIALLILVYNMGEFLCRMIWGDSIVISDIYKRKSK